jgi:hypothetical protein
VADAATSSASARSAQLSANQGSATRSLTDSLGHPAGQQVSGTAHGRPFLNFQHAMQLLQRSWRFGKKFPTLNFYTKLLFKTSPRYTPITFMAAFVTGW